MSTEVLITIITLAVTNILSPIITWYQAKKKYNSEVDANLIANMKESLDFYRTLSDDNKERLSEVLQKIDYLEKENSDLKNQMLKLTMSICMDLTCKHRIYGEPDAVKNTRKHDNNKEGQYGPGCKNPAEIPEP